MTHVLRRAALGAVIVAFAALTLSACAHPTPASVAAGAVKGAATGAVKGAFGAIF